MSYVNGKITEKIMESANCDFQYVSKSGIICVGGSQGSYFDYDNNTEISYGGYDIIKLTDSFEDIDSISWSQVQDLSSGNMVGEEYKINDSDAGSMEEIVQFIQSYDYDVSVEAWSMTCLYRFDEGIKSSFLNLYDTLRTTAYNAYDPEIVTFELSDGVLTVVADDGSRFGWNRHAEGFSISYPVAEDCVWETGYFSADFVATDIIDYETVKSYLDEIQAEYEKYGDVNSPMGLYIEVTDGVVVRVYTAFS